MSQTAQSFTRQVARTLSANYLLHLPTTYESAPDKQWPVILFLHGAGERGDNLELVKRWGPPHFVEEQPDFPFIVASPQCPEGHVWDADLPLAILDEVLAKYRVDRDRVYLTGLSMGGFATFAALAVDETDRFAAFAPICGGGEASWVKSKHAKTAWWIFHGAKDQRVPVLESEKMAEALRDAGAEVHLTIYPEADHNSWTVTYANPELYAWFLQHKRL